MPKRACSRASGLGAHQFTRPRTCTNAEGLDRLIARFRLVRDRVFPHAWSVFHCVATPRIPVHHPQELTVGGKLPSYFLLKRLTQSFPLEWCDVLRYQRLR